MVSAYSIEVPPPAEVKATSMPLKSSLCFSSLTIYGFPRNVYSRPALRDEPNSTTVFDIYAVDLKKTERKDITEKDIKNIIRMYQTASTEGITHYRFDITNHPKDPNEYDALERFIIDFRSPFKIARVDSLLRQRGIAAKDIHIERADSMVWLPLRFNHTSTFNPHITISYFFTEIRVSTHSS